MSSIDYIHTLLSAVKITISTNTTYTKKKETIFEFIVAMILPGIKNWW